MRKITLLLVLTACAGDTQDQAESTAAQEAIAVATLAQFEAQPRKQRTCEAAQHIGAQFLNYESAWQYWRANALGKYCGGSR